METMGDRRARAMTPVRKACFGLSLIGVAVGIYLTIAHFTSSSILACPSQGIINCARVTSSQQSYFLKIPVALWGLAFYLYLSVINSPWGFRQESLRVPRLGSMFLGVAFVLWLISAELLIIDSICLWCTVVHVVTIFIFALVVYDYFSSPSSQIGGE